MATAATIVTVDLSKVCEQLERDEGYQQLPYVDPLRKLRVMNILAAAGLTFEQFLQIAEPTIGCGFNLASDGLTLEESRLILRTRAWRRYLALITALPWVKQLDESRQGVLLNMAYNVGVTTLETFVTFLTLVKAGSFDAAADDLKGTKWAHQVGERAVRLEQQMRSGEWQ